MTGLLQQAFKRAKQLPTEAQNALAALILEEIEGQEWEVIIAKAEVQQKLLSMANEAWQEYERGETEEGGFAL